jgi:hypothetical protein
MINIKLLLAIVVIYCVLFLLFGFLSDVSAIFISNNINNVNRDILENPAEFPIAFKIGIIIFIIINIFVLYYFINKHIVSIPEFYIFGFIIYLLFFGLLYIDLIDDRIKSQNINNKHKGDAYLISTTLMMFLNGAIYATIAKLAYYYKLVEYI